MKRGVAAAIAATFGFALPFFVAFTAWPEIPTCAYLVTIGLRLYDNIFFPHTPLLILLTAALGRLFGFTAMTIRAIAGLSLAAACALLVIGARRKNIAVPLFIGVPILLALSLWAGGPTLWPDPFLSPFLLGGVLLLERFERDGDKRALFLGSLVLGTCILVKQTSAWLPIISVLWIATRSLRRGVRPVAIALAGALIPYGAFVVVWGALFRSVAHVRWTLLVPLQMSAAGDNRVPLGWSELHETLAPFLAIAALLLALAALPRAHRFRSPAPWIALAVFGMSYPRADLLHLSAAHGVLTLLFVRAVLALIVFARRGRLRSPSIARTIFATAAASALLTIAGVALIGGGSFFIDRFGGPTFYWNDKRSREWEQIVRRRAHRGDEVMLVGIAWDTLYPRIGIRPVGGVYVNTSLWDCINKEGAGERVVDALQKHPGALILFAESSDDAIRSTAIYRFVATRTEIIERVDAATAWRRVTR